MKEAVYSSCVLFLVLNRERIYLVSHTFQRFPSRSFWGYANGMWKIKEILLHDIGIEYLNRKHLKIKKK